MKKISALLVFLMFVSATVVIAADTAGTGRISGKVMTRDSEPLADGMILFFSKAIGPPPFKKKYMRTPDNIAVTDSDGKFSAEVPEGEYYIGGMKLITEGWGGPPREGDVFFVSEDEDGNPKVYIVDTGKQIDIGVVSEPVQDEEADNDEAITITAIEGTIRDMHGNPLEDAVVFAYTSSTMDDGLSFVSGYTGTDGRYVLRVHKGGKYYLNIMGEFGTLFPMSGITITDNGQKAPTGVTVMTGEIKKKVDIRLTGPR